MGLAEDALNLLFPPHCPICNAYVEFRGGWCDECLRKSLEVHRVALDADMSRAISGAWALGHYRSGLRNLLRDLKYKKKRQVLPYIRTLQRAGDAALLPLWQEELNAVPVPLYKARERERGFNQAELLFKEWLGEHGISMMSVLLRCRNTTPQYGLGAAERKNNLRDAFEVRTGTALGGRNLLLVDDILTTGATLYECAKVLKQNGAGKIYALVMASDRV